MQSFSDLRFGGDGHPEGGAHPPSLGGVEGVLELVEAAQEANLENPGNTLVLCWEDWKQSRDLKKGSRSESG